MLSGEVGTTSGYDLVNTILTPQNTSIAEPFLIAPYLPHTVWPSPDAKEDSVLLVWAHPNPDDLDERMDRLFFQNLLMYVSDVAEGKEKLDVAQIMLTQ